MLGGYPFFGWPFIRNSTVYTIIDVGQCNVLYDYQANESDELTIKPGDVINIIDKYDVEWWQGELNGTVGIFPASYVEET